VGQLRNPLESLPGLFSLLSLGALDGQLGKCVTLAFVNSSNQLYRAGGRAKASHGNRSHVAFVIRGTKDSSLLNKPPLKKLSIPLKEMTLE
jgi:hypothetical protein